MTHGIEIFNTFLVRVTLLTSSAERLLFQGITVQLKLSGMRMKSIKIVVHDIFCCNAWPIRSL